MVRSPVARSGSEALGRSTGSMDTQCGYYIHGFKICTRFQQFAKPQVFLIVLILQGIVQSTCDTFFIKTILSTKLGISYSSIRWLLFGSEMVLLVLAVPFIYLGSIRSRPVWLALSTALLSVFSLLFSSQLLLEHAPKNAGYNDITRDISLCERTFQSQWIDKLSWKPITTILLVLMYYTIRLSAIVYWAFGISYMDDNSKNSPLFIGISLAFKQFGSFFGLFLASYSPTFHLKGIYWLSVGLIILLVSIITGMFPKRLDEYNVSQSGDSGLIPALKRISTHKIIILYGIGTIFISTFVFNFTNIEDKYIESTFFVSSSTLFKSYYSLQYFFGILKPTLAALTLLISGIIINKLKPKAVVLCVWSIISICLASLTIFAIIFLKCSDTPIHRDSGRNDLVENCNANCGCSDDIPFMPTCTQYYPFVYYSPCHAGCTSKTLIKGSSYFYSNCTCLPTQSAEVGHCSGGKCKIYWWVFNILEDLAIIFLASGIIGNLYICLRSVLPCDKAIMIGTVYTIAGFAANVPFKFVYDFIANQSCLYFVDNNCKIYKSDTLVTYINLFHICLLLLAAACFVGIFFLVQELSIYEVKDISQPGSELQSVRNSGDFRAHLNQTLASRRESTVEEQKALLNPSRQSANLNAHENNVRSSFIEEDSRQKSSVNGNANEKLQRPLPPNRPPSTSSAVDENYRPVYGNIIPPLPPTIPSNSDDGNSSELPSNNKRKPSALINELKATLSNSSINSIPSPSPTHESGTTFRNQGFLTTMI